MSNPTIPEYVQLSVNSYEDESAFDSSPSGPVYVDGDIGELVSVPETLTKYDGMTVIDQSPSSQTADGFAAIAVQDSAGNIIIINEGTVPGISGFDRGTLSADIQAGEGKTPAALTDAATFAQAVETKLGNNTLIYVTGHSLGGIEAEAEAQEIITKINPADFGGGATFGATGLPGQTAVGGPSTLIDYVDYGDPVGNYAKDTATQTVNDLAPNAPVYYHYGKVVPVGVASNAAYLKDAQAYSEAIDPQDKLSFAGGGASVTANILATVDEALAIKYHGIANYASDIIGSGSGITGAGSPPPSLDWITQAAELPYGNAANSASDVINSDGSVSTPYFTTSYNSATDQIIIDQTGTLGTSQGPATGGGVITLSLDPTNGLVKSATYASTDGSLYNAAFNETTGNLQSLEANESDGASYQIQYTFNADGSFSSTTNGYSGTNLTGTLQFTQTASASASGAVAAGISGTGDAVGLANAAITLAAKASASVSGTGNKVILGAGASVSDSSSDFATDNLTFKNASGNSVTLNAGTFTAASQYFNSGTTGISLITPDYTIGTLGLNTGTNSYTFTLADGLTVTLPTIATDTVAALSSTVTPYTALKDYLADLGYTGNVATLDSAYQNPTGTSYSVTGQVTGFAPESGGKTYAVVGYTPGAPGASMIGQNSAMYNGTTYDAYNYIYVPAGGTSDLTNDTWSNMQALTLTSSTAELTGAQFAGFSNLTGNGQIVFTTAGSYSLAGDAADNGLFSLTAQSWGGTTLTGDATNYQTLTASLYGNDTLNAGSGTGDVLNAGEGVDTITAGSGGDIIYALNGLAAGSRVTGNLATPDAFVASGDISGATITNQRYITIGNGTATSVGMTAAQLAGFTGGIYLGAATVGINAASGGTFNLLNAPLVGASGSDRIMLNAISNAATTLTGDDTASATGYVSTLIASGNGNDTLTTGGDAGDSLSATGNGNDSLAAGNGNNDALSASGNGNDTLSAGSGAGDSLSATGNGNNTLTAGGGASDTLSASGTGTNILIAGNGAGDQLTAMSGSDTLTSGSGNGDILTAQSGGNTLNAGGGTGDVLTAMGGGNILNGGNGGDTFNIYDDANQATGGSGNDTFNLLGDSSVTFPDYDTASISLAGSVITGGGGTDTLTTEYGTLDVSSGTLSGIEVISGMQHLTITAAEMASVTHLAYGLNNSGSLSAVTPGTYSVATSDTVDAVRMIDAATGGSVTLTDNNVAGDLVAGVNAGDVLSVGSGAGDAITALGDASTLTAGNGAGDTLIASSGNGDTLTAGNGTGDVLTASGNNTILKAGSGNGDVFNLFGTNDTATGGSGSTAFIVSGSNATIQGGGGIDSYAINTTGGDTVINNYHTGSGTSALTFGSAFTTSNVVATQNGNNLLLTQVGAANEVTVQNYFGGADWQLNVDFASGTVWNPATLTAMVNQAPITVANNTTTTVTASGRTVSAGSSDTVSVNGASGDTVAMSGSTNTVSDNSASTYNIFKDTSSGSGNKIQLNGADDSAALAGSSDTATESGTHESITVTGTGDSATDSGSGYNSLTVSGNTSWAYANGYDSVTTVSGNNGGFVLTGALDSATLSGNNASATLSGSVESAVIKGTGDTVVDNGNAVTLSGTNGKVTLNGQYASATLSGTGDTATVTGTSDTVTVNEANCTVTLTSASTSCYVTLNAANDTVVDNGTGNTTTANSTPTTVTVAGSGGTVWDWGGNNSYTLTGANLTALLYGSNSTATVSGTNAATQLAGNNESAKFTGTGEVVTLDGSSETALVTGNNDTSNDHGSQSSVTLSGTGDTGNVYSSGGTITVSGASSTVNLEGTGQTASIASTVSSGSATIMSTSDIVKIAGTSSESITFNANALGTLLLQSAQTFTGIVAGLASGDGIDLANFQFSKGATISKVTGTGAAGTDTFVSVTDNGVTAQLALLNQYANQFGVSASAYTLTSDSTQANAGTLLQLAAAH